MPSLGHDLASVRKDINLSIEDVHHSTKIPLAILESIENDSIFTTLNENQTYIRSYIRTYARALKIADDEIIRALDQHEEGNYTGFIAPQESSESKKGDTEAGPGKEMATDDEADISQPTGHPASDEQNDEPVDDHPQVSPPPTVNSVDWADMGRKFIPLPAKSRMWVGLTLLVVAIAIAGSFAFYQYYFITGESESQFNTNPGPTQVSTPSPDSLQLNFTTPNSDSIAQSSFTVSTLDALPDTLNMIVYAAYGVLEPVRVYSDVMNSLNPYWIEQGEAYQFDFVNTIRIRGQYSRMVLLLNGHVIDNFRQQFLNPETGMLEIERSVFENDPTWLQPPPDSMEINAPPPTIVRERPTFN